MSAPHILYYDVFFEGVKIDSFYLDVDLDNLIEVFEDIRKLFNSEWFNATILFRFSEHIYCKASKSDFTMENFWFNSKRGELRLVLTHCKDFG